MAVSNINNDNNNDVIDIDDVADACSFLIAGIILSVSITTILRGITDNYWLINIHYSASKLCLLFWSYPHEEWW